MFFRKKSRGFFRISGFFVLQCFLIINVQNIFDQNQPDFSKIKHSDTLSPRLSVESLSIRAIFSDRSKQLIPEGVKALPLAPVTLRDTGSITAILEGKDVFLNDHWARKTLGVPTAISSLRSESADFDQWDWGKGDMGESSRQHILWLAKNGFSRWMRLPNRKTYTLFGDPSPYYARSAFAGEDSDIAVPEVEDFINSKEAQDWYKNNEQRIIALHNTNRVESLEVSRLKNEALWLAMQYFKATHLNQNTKRGKDFEKFLQDKDNDWVKDYADYMAISEHYWDQKQDIFYEINELLWTDIDAKLKDLLNMVHYAINVSGTKDVGILFMPIDDFFDRYLKEIAAKEKDQFRRNIHEFLLDKIKRELIKAPIRCEIKKLLKANPDECRKLLFEMYEKSKQAFRYDLKEAIGQECMADWRNWDNEGLVQRDPRVLAHYREFLKDKVLFHKYAQFVFDEQEKQMKKFANDHGIAIEGDIPFYVATVSCDTWVHKDKVFRLDPKNRYQQIHNAGAPQDQYEPEYGQNWERAAVYYMNDHFRNFFYKRTKRELRNIDGVRIDHFRAFYNFWAIPQGELGRAGWFEDGPRDELLQPMLKLAFGQLKRLFAEDLGSYLEEVWDFMADNEIKGFRVMMFGHGDDDDPLHREYSGQIAFSGTHDTATWIGAWNKWDEKKRKILLDRFFYDDIPEIWQRLGPEQRQGFKEFLGYFLKQLKKETEPITQLKAFQFVNGDIFDEDNNFEAAIQIIRNVSEALVYFDELPRGVQTAIFGILAFSEADTVFFPMQDIFRQGEAYRINVPGKPGDWGYRHPYTGQQLNEGKIEEIKNADELMRILSRTSGRDVNIPLYKKGDGVHILGISPGINAKKMVKQGEEFVIWAAVQGDKPEKVSVLTNMPDFKGAYPKEQAVEMELVKELSSGTYLYGVRIRATQAGKWGVAVCADNARVGDVRDNMSLIVTASDDIKALTEEQKEFVHIADGLGNKDIQRILDRQLPDQVNARTELLEYHQLEPLTVEAAKINSQAKFALDLVYGNVNMLRQKLLKADAEKLNTQVHGLCEKYAMDTYLNSYFSDNPQAALRRLVNDLANIAALPGDPQLVIGQFLDLLAAVKASGKISDAEYAAAKKAIDDIVTLSRDNLFRKGNFFLLNDFRDQHSYNNILAFSRYSGKGRGAIVISNHSDYQQAGVVWLNRHNFEKMFGISPQPGNFYALIDRLTGEVFIREGRELLEKGLYFDLPEHGSHVFMVQSLQDNNNKALESLRNAYQGKALESEHIIWLMENFGLILNFPCQGKIAKASALHSLLSVVSVTQLREIIEDIPGFESMKFKTSLEDITAQITGFRKKYESNQKVQALCNALDFLRERGVLNGIKLICAFNQDKTSAVLKRYRSYQKDDAYLYVTLSDAPSPTKIAENSAEILMRHINTIGYQLKRAMERNYGGVYDNDVGYICEAFLTIFGTDNQDVSEAINNMTQRIDAVLGIIEERLEPALAKEIREHFGADFLVFGLNIFRDHRVDFYLSRVLNTNVYQIKNFAVFLPYYLAKTGRQNEAKKILTAGMAKGKDSYYNKYFLESFIFGALLLKDSNIDDIFIDFLEDDAQGTDFYFQQFVVKAMHSLRRFELKVNGIGIESLGAVLKAGKEIQSLREAAGLIEHYQTIEQAI